MRTLFLGWDALYARLHRLRAVDGFVRIERTRYRGRTRTFDDGTVIEPGDALVVLHFNNAYLSEVQARSGGGSLRSAWVFGTSLLRSMHRLAGELQRDRRFSDVAALTGITWFRPHGGSIGFVAEPLPGGFRKTLLTLHFRTLLAAMFPELARRENRRLEPHRFWLTRRQLFDTLSGEDNYVAQRLSQRRPARSAK